jgi:integrase
MPQKPTGNVYEKRGRWYARVRLAPNERRLVPLATCATREQAEARLAILVELVPRLREGGVALGTMERLVLLVGERDGAGLADVLAAADALARGDARVAGAARAQSSARASGPTVRELGERWTSGELARLHPDHVRVKRSAEDDRLRLEKHVYPRVGDVPITSFTLDMAEDVMRRIPGERSPATRRHVAQLLVRLLALAVFPLRLITATPLPRGFLPKLGASKALPYLYPDEDRRLLACAEIPLCWRVLYGFLVREGCRRGEAYAMTIGDLDLERGSVTLDKNKTDDPRAWALSPGVARGLAAWVKLRQGDGPALRDDAPAFVDEDGERPADQHLADRLRADLLLAGVDRAALHRSSAERRHIWAHDLRGTFVTLALANGMTESWVMDRTGHRSSTMIARYRRQARTAAELHLGELDPLDVAIPELGPAVAPSPAREPSPGDAAGDAAEGGREAREDSRAIPQGCAMSGSDHRTSQRRNLKPAEAAAIDAHPPQSRALPRGDGGPSDSAAPAVARASPGRRALARGLADGGRLALAEGDERRGAARGAAVVDLDVERRRRGGGAIRALVLLVVAPRVGARCTKNVVKQYGTFDTVRLASVAHS